MVNRKVCAGFTIDWRGERTEGRLYGRRTRFTAGFWHGTAGPGTSADRILSAGAAGFGQGRLLCAACPVCQPAGPCAPDLPGRSAGVSAPCAAGRGGLCPPAGGGADAGAVQQPAGGSRRCPGGAAAHRGVHPQRDGAAIAAALCVGGSAAAAAGCSGGTHVAADRAGCGGHRR